MGRRLGTFLTDGLVAQFFFACCLFPIFRVFAQITPCLAGVGFDLAPGQCLHLEGGNGVGKTSLLRILAGFAPAAQGQVRWQGEVLGSSACRLAQDLLYLGHQLALKEELNAVENLQAGAAIAGTPVMREAALAALQQLGLGSRATLPVSRSRRISSRTSRPSHDSSSP